MNWTIFFLLACLNVLVIAPRTDQDYRGGSSRSNENEQEYLEELYDRNFVLLLNSIPTLAETPVHFFDWDIESLIKEFYINENLLNLKKVSVEMYRRKMQEIQCVNGLFILYVLRKLKENINRTKITVLKNDLNQLVSNYMFYLTRMLSMLHRAKWDAYPWQIEIFTFVTGLKASDVNYENYRDHFEKNNRRIEKTVFEFIMQCVSVKYIVLLDQSITERIAISSLVDNVYETMDLLYKDDETLAYAYNLADHYNVPNLMLIKLHSNHKIIYDWSNVDIELKMNNVEIRLKEYLTDFGRQQLSHQWELDPIRGNKYNTLIAECIHLKVVYFTWFHLYTYHTVQSRPPAVNERDMEVDKSALLAIWHTLVIPLKIALRVFRFNENIYWAAMNDMMAKINSISRDELKAREQFTRNYFCRAVENLGLAKASDVNRQLLTKVKVEDNYVAISDRILKNANMLHNYIDKILYKLGKDNGVFVRLIVSAEGNETFILQ